MAMVFCQPSHFDFDWLEIYLIIAMVCFAIGGLSLEPMQAGLALCWDL